MSKTLRYLIFTVMFFSVIIAVIQLARVTQYKLVEQAALASVPDEVSEVYQPLPSRSQDLSPQDIEALWQTWCAGTGKWKPNGCHPLPAPTDTKNLSLNN